MTKVACSVCKTRVDKGTLYRSQGMVKVCSEDCFRRSYEKKPPTHALKRGNQAPKRVPMKKRSKKKTGDPTPKTRKRVMVRDNGRCRYCGTPASTLHHIHYRSEHWPDMHAEHNLIVLCSKHHDEMHSRKRHWQPVLLAAIWLYYTGSAAAVNIKLAEQRIATVDHQ